MENRDLRLRGSAVAFAVALLWSVASASASEGNIAVYWGQKGNEASLEATCKSGNFEIVMIAFLNKFGKGQNASLDLAGHCTTEWATCKKLSADIESCQKQYGVKVFLSLGGDPRYSNYGITSEDDANNVAKYLWDTYLGGKSDSRPLGAAVLDGIDLDIEYTTENWEYLAKAISGYSTSSKKVYLSAAPQCPYPDKQLNTALQTKLFDYVWIQFYNNDCQYANGDASKLVSAWNTWTTSVTTLEPRGFYLGIPGAPGAANTGYVDPGKLISDVLPEIKKSSKYGGVMLWNKYWEEQTHYNGATSYSSAIKNDVKVNPSLADEPTLPSF